MIPEFVVSLTTKLKVEQLDFLKTRAEQNGSTLSAEVRKCIEAEAQRSIQDGARQTA
jgi:hypothetical protein